MRRMRSVGDYEVERNTSANANERIQEISNEKKLYFSIYLSDSNQIFFGMYKACTRRLKLKKKRHSNMGSEIAQVQK